MNDITLSSSARRVAIVGCNGSGKSSLGRLITGLEAPDEGQVRVFGMDMATDRAQALMNVGLIFQNPDHQIIFPTVHEEIGFGLDNLALEAAEREDRIRSILARFSAQDWYDRPVTRLSQGQRHLVCLMSVLAMAPKLILLDEPYTGLDIPTAARMRRLLDDLEQHVVLITHDPQELRGFDELVWLDEGSLRAHGACESVLADFLEEMERRAQTC
ncbi:MAG: energy-coupling factor ABC transporter ATP-binding protein [Neomegalonema sp.]|nr:energy-coupling factor ABC transporter ATP-binding protein [Neomegalonema sp.]